MSHCWTLGLPDLSGIDVMIAIRAEFSNARIVVLTMFDGDVEVQTCSCCRGLVGYVMKSTPPEEMLDIVRQVHLGKKYIPQQVAEMLAEHIGEQEIRRT